MFLYIAPYEMGIKSVLFVALYKQIGLINNYVNANEHAGEELKSKFPLRDFAAPHPERTDTTFNLRTLNVLSAGL